MAILDECDVSMMLRSVEINEESGLNFSRCDQDFATALSDLLELLLDLAELCSRINMKGIHYTVRR